LFSTKILIRFVADARRASNIIFEAGLTVREAIRKEGTPYAELAG
jgi:hypothetical protein